MEAHLHDEKLARVRQAVTGWLGRRSAMKREILSLVGLLQHAAKVVRPGRTFVRHVYSVALRVRELGYFTKLNQGFRSDLYWWLAYLSARLEWRQPSSTSSSCTTSHDPPDRRVGDLGLWGFSLPPASGFSCNGQMHGHQ